MKIQAIVCIALLLIAFPALAKQKAAVPVFVQDVVAQHLVDEIEALGTLQANEKVDLMSSVTERITVINFESGQRVRKGDVLVEMESAEEEALLAEEKSIVNEAKRQVERLRPLITRGAASQSTMDEAQLEMQTAQSRIAAIISQMKERHIVAPFDGKLGLRNISVGVMAQPGTLITTIDDDSKLKLDFSVPERYLPSIEEGGKITATAKAFPGRVFAGVVESIDSRVDTVSRAITVRAILENSEHKLLPGMLMRVVLQKNPRKAIVIPEEALVPEGNKNYVFTLSKEGNDKKVSFVAVKLGTRKKGMVEVLSGIKEGDRIVTHGTLRLQDGDRVVVRALDNDNPTLDEMLQQKFNGE
ncbi:efflux RND transporter periplasmic adaptor subunit [Desulfogranum marinum]|uniref:efflux RND transporter periplasmic adaptor subunit n=1 Tax=Desulfogranum marinum TaxID=453220 RepID=UPI001964007A|nr:efflux RND transporter periplasmic adaptor subunit [Desulfogranum marinum]MBM9514768.1 efflux RND transporter periplasmic adaptor subunit [Desulfogranum marinum]